jgi:hypothetical protein
MYVLQLLESQVFSNSYPRKSHLLSLTSGLNQCLHVIVLFTFFFCTRDWIQASLLLGKHFTTWSTCLILLILVCFSDRILCYLCPGWLRAATLLPLSPKELGPQACSAMPGPIYYIFIWPGSEHVLASETSKCTSKAEGFLVYLPTHPPSHVNCCIMCQILCRWNTCLLLSRNFCLDSLNPETNATRASTTAANGRDT